MKKWEATMGRRLILLVIVTLLCLEGLFYLWYTPSKSSPSCNEASQLNGAVSESEATAGGGGGGEGGGGGGGGEERGGGGRGGEGRGGVEEEEGSQTVILIWRLWFGHQVELGSCRKLFNITGCRLTNDHNEYSNVDGVMFHHRDIHRNVSELLRMKRPPLQKWVWMNMESPRNSPRQAWLDGVFNLTASYRRDSDIWVPYGRVTEAAEHDTSFQIPTKDKLICWIVNNWDTHLKRVQYFYELRKHVQVHTYGGAFERLLSFEEYYRILSSCKFYLSFENSIDKDYFTEKLFNPMKMGTVPVVLGPSRENYEEFIPADSFIHVDDFKSAEDLAKHLTFLDQNQEEYEHYFSWRQHFIAKGSYFGLEHACYSCDHIKRHKGYRVFKNLSKWFWG